MASVVSGSGCLASPSLLLWLDGGAEQGCGSPRTSSEPLLAGYPESGRSLPIPQGLVGGPCVLDGRPKDRMGISIGMVFLLLAAHLAGDEDCREVLTDINSVSLIH